MRKQVSVFQNSQVYLEKGLIQCGNYTCCMTAAAQIYLEKYSDSWLFFGALGEDALILELNSGSQYIFLSKDEAVLSQAYIFLCNCLADGVPEGKWLIDFSKGVIRKWEPEETSGSVIELNNEEDTTDLLQNSALKDSALQEQPAFPGVIPTDHVLMDELRQLAAFFEHQVEDQKETLDLVSRIEVSLREGKQEVLLPLYDTFIKGSLIQTCNELGLNRLIGEIVTRVYHM